MISYVAHATHREMCTVYIAVTAVALFHLCVVILQYRWEVAARKLGRPIEDRDITPPSFAGPCECPKPGEKRRDAES
jgi:hypothetical protein